MTRYDAILILGGGVRAGGVLPPWARRRFDRALERYAGEYVLPLSAGTVHHPPPLDGLGYPIIESVAGGEYLARHGIPVERIIPETCSYDTIGNAYFSRVCHVDPLGLRHLLVITSEFHMPRSEFIFRWVYGMEPARATLTFEAVPDEGLPASALMARRVREAESLERVRQTAERIRTLAELQRWLYTEHEAYRVNGRPEGPGMAAGTY